MKIRGIISTSLDFDKYYLRHDLEQYSRGFNPWSDTLCNANASGTITFEPYSSTKNTQ